MYTDKNWSRNLTLEPAKEEQQVMIYRLIKELGRET